MHTYTYTYVELEVPPVFYDLVAEKLCEAGYFHQQPDGSAPIDMHGIALKRGDFEVSYTPQKPTDEELENRFRYHRPGLHSAITEGTLALAKVIRDITPLSRQQSLALTALEEVRMWANAAIGAGCSEIAPPPSTPLVVPEPNKEEPTEDEEEVMPL